MVKTSKFKLVNSRSVTENLSLDLTLSLWPQNSLSKYGVSPGDRPTGNRGGGRREGKSA